MQPENSTRRFRSPGAADLRQYIAQHHLSIAAFARDRNLDVLQVHRVMNGHIVRVSVDFAFDIERATGGRVKAIRFRVARSLVRTPKNQSPEGEVPA